MAERITGTEMEYPISVRVNTEDGGYEDSVLSSTQAAEIFKYCLPEELVRIGNGLSSNGARLYMDMGAYVEYATPEDKRILEGTAANEIAGERIVEGVMRAATTDSRVKRGDKFDAFSMYKRVLNGDGNPKISWGYHENYMALRDRVPLTPEGLMLLGLHLATRNLYVGGGMIRKTGGDNPPVFYLAQKASVLTSDFAAGTTESSKPLVNTRDEPHADKEKYARVHVVCGDPHMSPWAMRMQLGTTSLVLRMRERGIKLEHLYLPENHMHLMAKQVAVDVAMKQTVELANGKTIRPLDIQGELYENAGKLAEDGFDEDEEWTMAEWAKALEDIEADPMRLKDRADWALMKYLMEGRYADGIDFLVTRYNSLDSSRLDPKDPKGLSSLGLYFRKNLWKQYMPEEALIEDRILNPPHDTRAHARGYAVTMLTGRKLLSECEINWGGVTLKAGFPGANNRARTYRLEPDEPMFPDDLWQRLQPLS